MRTKVRPAPGIVNPLYSLFSVPKTSKHARTCINKKMSSPAGARRLRMFFLRSEQQNQHAIKAVHITSNIINLF
jgi:hypothetical protein